MKIFTIILLLTISILYNLYSVTVLQLAPKPKTAYMKEELFTIDPYQTKIYFPLSSGAETKAAISYLQRLLKEYSGLSFDFQTADLAEYKSGLNGIVIGELHSSADFDKIISETANKAEMNLVPEGYILDVSANRISIAAGSGKGVFNAITTLLQLITPGNFSLFAVGSHLWDYPDYSDRWVIGFQNLLVNENQTVLKNLLDTLAFRKLYGFQHTDFKYNILELMQANYFDNVKKFQTLCNERNIELIPGVMNFGWSSGILYKNPNLAEGLPTSAKYVIESDTGKLITDSRVTLPNGDFETLNGNGKFTGWSYYDEAFASQDKTTFHSGNASAKCTGFDGTNSRFSKTVDCQPYRGYVLSAWVKTENFQGDDVRLFAYGNEGSEWRALTFTNLNIPATSGNWINVQVYFNTLYFKKVALYCGVWGARKGTIWWDDFKVYDLGLTNILRRNGTPLTVTNSKSGKALIEATDFENVTDNIMLSKRGEYGPFHQPPTFKIIKTGNIKNGDTVLISSYHPFTAVSDNNISGSTMVCVSEDTVYKIVEDQSIRLDNMLKPSRFFMSHDEIRNLNWDDACSKRTLSAADLLGDNITKCYDILKKISPEAEILMWSDMVDSLHNATKNYYLINGDLGGIWKNIPKDLTIVNWNGGKAKPSLDWFSKQGFKQISSPYYDDRSTNNIRMWRLAQIGIPNVKGMMYTTWANDYSLLTPFSYYAWGGGPTIYFKPFDSTVFNMKSVSVLPVIYRDMYDANDSIVKAFFIVERKDNDKLKTDTILMKKTTSIQFEYNWQDIPAETFRYKIWTVNAQGIERETPFYICEKGEPDGVFELRLEAEKYNLKISPNPATDYFYLSFHNPISQIITISLVDIFGREIKVIKDEFLNMGAYESFVSLENLPVGLYFVNIKAGTISLKKKIVIN